MRQCLDQFRLDQSPYVIARAHQFSNMQQTVREEVIVTNMYINLPS